MVDTEEMIPAVSAEGPGQPDLRNLDGGLNTSTEGPAASQGSGRVDLRTLRELDAAVHTCGLSVKQEPHDSDHKPFHHPGVHRDTPEGQAGTPGAAPSQPTVRQVSLPEQWALKPRSLLAGGL